MKNRKNKQALNIFRSYNFSPEEEDVTDFDVFYEKFHKEVCEIITEEIEEKKSR